MLWSDPWPAVAGGLLGLLVVVLAVEAVVAWAWTAVRGGVDEDHDD